MTETVRILGIDPGSRLTGYGVIDTTGSELTFVAAGAIRCKDDDFNARLRRIHEGVRALIDEHHPAEMSVEQVFVSRNASSALKLGAARSAAICASFEAALDIAEYAPRAIKLAVTGTGAADKEQVQHMMRAMLGLRGKLQADAADALAVAICHANSRRLAARMKASLVAGR